MKRFIGYVALCTSMAVALGIGIAASFRTVNGNSEYSSSKEFVFKVSDRILEDGANENGTTTQANFASDSNALSDIIDEFETRLNNIKLTDHTIKSVGGDMISVTFKTKDSYYDDVVDYLTFSWSFMMSTYTESSVLGSTASDIQTSNTESNFFTSGNAYMEYKDNYPYVVIPMNDVSAFKDLVGLAEKDPDDSNARGMTSIKKEDESGDGSKTEETKPENLIYILNDWLDGFSVKDLVDNKSTSYMSKEDYHNHVLFTFDTKKLDSFLWEYDSDKPSSDDNYDEIYFGGYNLVSSVSEGGTYGQASQTAEDAYMEALIWLNKFNSTTYKYQITNINASYPTDSGNNNVSPTEERIVFMDSIQSSTILIATLIAMFMILLVYILNYGINGIIGSITTFGSSTIALVLFNALGVEFNLGTILGVVALTFIGLFASMGFFNKIKKEIYMGKNFKKAHFDGSKKAFWLAFDLSIIAFIIGLVSYLMPNGVISSFGITVLIGSVFAFINNALVLRYTSWFLYNGNIVDKHPGLIGLDKKFIPDLTRDEKPTYFEPFKKEKISPKKKKGFSIALACILAIAAGGIIGFGAATGNFFNVVNAESNSEIVIEQNVPSKISNVDNVISTFEDDFHDHFKKDSSNSEFLKNLDVDVFYYSYEFSGATKYEYYYVVTLDGVYSDTSTVYYRESTDDEFKSTQMLEAFANYATSVISMNGVDSESISLKKVKNIDNNTYLLWTMVALAISAAAILIVYILRYGITKALSGFGIIAASTLSTIGLISITRLPVSSSIITCALPAMLIVAVLVSLFYIGEREKLRDNKALFKEDIGARDQAYLESNNLDFSFAKITLLICAFPVISLLFAKGVSSSVVIMLALGCVLALAFARIFGTSAQKVISKFLKSVKDNFKLSFKSKKPKKHDNDDGPEEAIFTGIND